MEPTENYQPEFQGEVHDDEEPTDGQLYMNIEVGISAEMPEGLTQEQQDLVEEFTVQALKQTRSAITAFAYQLVATEPVEEQF